MTGDEKNEIKTAALTFLKLVTSGRVNEAFTRYVGDGFRHHNPFFEGSAKSLLTAMEESSIQNPDTVLDVKRVVAEGEFVVTHSHYRSAPGDRGVAVVHIFRFEKGRIAEFWDVIQPLPEELPNADGMF